MESVDLILSVPTRRMHVHGIKRYRKGRDGRVHHRGCEAMSPSSAPIHLTDLTG